MKRIFISGLELLLVFLLICGNVTMTTFATAIDKDNTIVIQGRLGTPQEPDYEGTDVPDERRVVQPNASQATAPETEQATPNDAGQVESERDKTSNIANGPKTGDVGLELYIIIALLALVMLLLIWSKKKEPCEVSEKVA